MCKEELIGQQEITKLSSFQFRSFLLSFHFNLIAVKSICFCAIQFNRNSQYCYAVHANSTIDRLILWWHDSQQEQKSDTIPAKFIITKIVSFGITRITEIALSQQWLMTLTNRPLLYNLQIKWYFTEIGALKLYLVGTSAALT